MAKFIINGKKPLRGEISVAGAKNAALKIIPAALLSDGPIILKNVPDIEDIHRSLELFTDLGGIFTREGDKLSLEIKHPSKSTLEATFVNKFRASIMFAAPLLAKQFFHILVVASSAPVHGRLIYFWKALLPWEPGSNGAMVFIICTPKN